MNRSFFMGVLSASLVGGGLLMFYQDFLGLDRYLGAIREQWNDLHPAAGGAVFVCGLAVAFWHGWTVRRK